MTKLQKEKQELQIIPAQLSPVIKDTQIELSKAEGHAMAFAPSMQTYLELAEVIKGMDKINPTDTMAKQAREARLKMVKVRTSAEEIKDLRKEGIKAEGDLIQALFNVVKNSCIVTETEFTEIEKHQERKEKERQDNLSAARIELLATFGTDTTYLPLGIMTEEQFNRLLETETIAFNARKALADKSEADRIETERLAEEARVVAAKKDAEDREAQRLENIRLQKENEAKQAQYEAERKTAQIAADKLAKENEAKLAEQQRLAKIEADKQAEELKKQKDAADKLAAELKARQDEEEKQRKRFEAEAKANQEREEAALRAPDKDKVRLLFEAIKAIQIPEFDTTEGKAIGLLAMGALKVLQADIIAESKKLV